MFITQGSKPENKFWKYLVGSLIIFFASTIGQIPFALVLFADAFSKGVNVPTDTNEALGFLNPNLSLFLIMISFVFAMAAIYMVVVYLHKQSWLSVTTGRKKVDWKRIFFSFGLWTLITTVSIIIGYYLAPQDFVFNFNLVPFLILAVIGIVLIPIQTSTEEYIFRGYLMQGFGNLAGNRWFPLVMTSLIFGLMHIANPEVSKMGYIIMVYYIGTGLFLGILTLMDDGMELALGFHAANNLIGALLVTTDWSALQTDSVLKDISEPTAGYDVLLPVFLIFPILLFIFSKKYQWSGWKEKLTGKIAPYGNDLLQTDDDQSVL